MHKKIPPRHILLVHARLTAAVIFGAVILAACGTPERKTAETAAPATTSAAPAAAPAPQAGDPAPASVAAAPAVVAMPPPAPREFRAAWVSTVANIDWPSRANLSVAQQKAEIDTLLERAKKLNLNAIILQVRPSADAIYPSALEPWSEYLTGRQGKAPEPFYDPLKTWIDGAHARGMELHAWFNPYRARHSTAKSPNAPEHIAVRNPAAVKAYGKFLWMDPGERAAADQTLAVMLDVVKRYDVDGVHIDDYFYPYPITVDAGNGDNGLTAGSNRPEVDFPDEASWNRYLAGGGKLGRADWRRENVNALVARIYSGVHKEKPWVKVGISPFGLPRPDRRPPGINGFSQYDKLYADAELWFNKGWVDYFAPQLYWPAAQAGQAFPVLLDYWMTQNMAGRALWPGLYTSRIADKTPKAFPAEEITGQVDLTRARGVGGHIHFSIAALSQNREGISTTLAAKQYAMPALVPAMPWLDKTLPARPTLSLVSGAGNKPDAPAEITLQPGAGKPVAWFAVWTECDGSWRFAVKPATRSVIAPAGEHQCRKVGKVVVTAVDRVGNESEAASLSLARKP